MLRKIIRALLLSLLFVAPLAAQTENQLPLQTGELIWREREARVDQMLDALAQSHKLLVTVEDGTVVNGFGAALAALVQTTAPDLRVVALGVPDRTYEHAPRAQQLAEVGLHLRC